MASVAAAVLLTLLIRIAFQLNPTPLILTGVIAAAWFGGKYPGLLACLLSDLAIDYLFEEPPYQFTLSTVHIVRLVILGVISLLTSARKNAEEKLFVRQQQQAVIAGLGQRALSAAPLQQLFDEAASLVNQTLKTDSCAIYKLISDENKLNFAAGHGWQRKTVPESIDFSKQNSLAGFVLQTEQPVIVRDFKNENRFTASNLISDNNFRSGLGVVIKLRSGNFGVLGAFDAETRSFSQDDVNFLQSVANVLAEAVERMLSEDAIQEQRKWLRTTLASIGDAVIATDRDGLITFMNPVAENLTGWKENDAIGKQLNEVFQIIDEKNNLQIENPVMKVIREGMIVGLANHTILISKNGSKIPIDNNAAPIRDENKNINGAVLVFRDVTAEKEIEREQQFLTDAAGVITASLDLKATISGLAAIAVPTLADLCIIDLQVERNEIQRMAVAAVSENDKFIETIKNCAIFDLKAERGIPNVLQTGKAEIFSKKSGLLNLDLVCGNIGKETPAELQISSAMLVPLIAHGRTLGAISFLLTGRDQEYDTKNLRLAQDFAHRAALAIDNARLYQTLQEANRIKDEFLATLSHELRTPLNSILGWSSLLRANNYSNDQVQKVIETIERNARLQKQIVEDVLDVSRIITGKFRLDVDWIDLSSVIEAAIETVKPSAAAKEIDINFVTADIPKIFGDAGRLQQAFWNLLSNAVKFTPKGGHIEITLGLFESSAEIKIRDTGKGISRDFLPFVFDRFRQADSSTTRIHGGLGLGLAIVRYVVELHGGDVRAESPGENLGSTFTICLPIAAVSKEYFEPAQTQTAQSSFSLKDAENGLKDLNILVVEDDADSRLMLATMLQQYGAKVKSASSSAEGLASLQNGKPDIIISDIGMPGEDGYIFIKKFRGLSSNEQIEIPAIALTAYAREEDRLQALTAGYQMHLAKPIDPEELITAIKNLLSVK